MKNKTDALFTATAKTNHENEHTAADSLCYNSTNILLRTIYTNAQNSYSASKSFEAEHECTKKEKKKLITITCMEINIIAQKSNVFRADFFITFFRNESPKS